MPAVRPCIRSGEARAGRVARGYLAIVVAIGCASRDEGAPAVVIDGEFADWRSVDAIPAGIDPRDGVPGIDSLAVQGDASAIYLSLDLSTEANVQGLDGAVLLVLDADGDPDTGPLAHGIQGADLTVSLSRILSPGEVRHGIAGWRPPESNPSRTTVPPESMDPYDLGMWFEPRHTARRVEIRLGRAPARPDAAGGSPGLVAGRPAAARVVTVDRWGGVIGASPPFEVPGAGRVARRPLRAGIDRIRPAAADDQPRAFRVVSWNVSRGRILATPGPAGRILAALDPDLVLLDEVPPEMSVADLQAVLPADVAGRAAWSIHLGTSGSRQRGAVAVRGELRPAPLLDHVPYPEAVGPLLTDPATADLREIVRNVETDGVPVTGAWVAVDGSRLLAVTLDLVCCGNSLRAPEEGIRRLEAGAVNEAVRGEIELRGRPGSAVLLAGDFNLVGSRAPLDLAGRGLAAGGGDLVPVRALQLDGATSATWSGGTGPFPPGQLDYLLFDPALVEVRRAFVFETSDVDPEALEALGLSGDDSDRASDHRPVVVDLVPRGRDEKPPASPG